MPLFNRPLPSALTPLHELATDLHWSWNHAGDQLLRQINADVWERTQNPIEVLQLTSDSHFEALAKDKNFVAQLNNILSARQKYMRDPAWYNRQYPTAPLRGVAYFSMEFGLCDALPLYAGGLGLLAGDFLKTASDLGVPLVAVGLLYQEGYFRQSLDENGWQQETYLLNEPGNMPIRPLRASDGSWLQIETEFLCRRVRFRVWQVQVGRITLYLLDSNDSSNQVTDRGITSQLYGGGTELRLVQEIALGICGWRLIETLTQDPNSGINIDVCHLNEGHAAFATLERIRAYKDKYQVDFWEALWATRGGNVFTTHTPVAAGFDRYPHELLTRYISQYVPQLGIDLDTLIKLGSAPANNFNDQSTQAASGFNMAYLAMHTCARSNGVSQLHGRVSQSIFQPLFLRWPQCEIPVGAVTNGVHIPTWDSSAADEQWTQLLGKDRWREDISNISPTKFSQLKDTELWQMAAQNRAELVDYTRQRLINQWRNEHSHNELQHVDLASCALPQDLPLDPNILTLGFARRFAEYKRPDLLLHDPERLARILCNSHYPVQLIVAGKAHPKDNTGKRALQRWHEFAQRQDIYRHLALVEDYDITLAQHLVQGVDLWINNPRRPWEACGTSGMKTLVNGGLNLSSLDGWWAEAYEPGVGWALGDGQEHGSEYDAQDAEQLYQLLENEIIPLFYQHNNQGLPAQWIQMMRASMSKLTARFSSNRMLQEYIDNYYCPAAQDLHARTQNNGAIAKELLQWQQELQKHWHEVHIERPQYQVTDSGFTIGVQVYLGGIALEFIKVQLFAEPITDSNTNTPFSAEIIDMEYSKPLAGAISVYHYTKEITSGRNMTDYTVRVISAHSHANIPAESSLIRWEEKGS